MAEQVLGASTGSQRAVSKPATASVLPPGSTITLPRSAVYRRAGKRAFDIVCAGVLLVILSVALIAIALMIKLDSHGPVFYRVRRVGYKGRPLWMLKFRKMHHGATGGPLTIREDPRFTKIGGVLTAARLDELPQLWDVLRGRMSIIGPRPEAPRFVDMHRTDYEQILTVRPGISGLAQIAYKEEARIVDAGSPVDDYVDRIMPQKLTLDTFYSRNCSLKLDLKVIYWTFVTVVLRHPVSVNRLTGAMNIRRRPNETSASASASTQSRALGSGTSKLVVPSSMSASVHGDPPGLLEQPTVDP